MKYKYFILSGLFVFTLLTVVKTKADLVAYWPLDEIVDGKVIDATGNGHDGTVIGSLKPTEGTDHKGLYFDGGVSYVDCGSEGFDKINEQITIAAWIKIEIFDKGLQTLVAKDGNIWQFQRGWDKNCNTLNFNIETANKTILRDGGVNGVTDVNDGNWHHVAGTYDGRDLKMYIDGKLNNTIAVGKAKLTKLRNNLTIGENRLTGDGKNTRSWHGEISQVAIFDHALTSSQLGLLYNTDPIICQKYSKYSDLLTHSDIELLRSIPAQKFDSFVACKQFLNFRKYSEAIEELDKLIKDDIASNKKPIVQDGVIKILDKMIQEDIDSYQSLINNAFLLKYQIYIQQNDIEKAFEVLQTLQKTHPTLNSAELTFSMANCYIRQDNTAKAKSLLLQIIQNYPENDYASKAKLCLSRIEQK